MTIVILNLIQDLRKCPVSALPLSKILDNRHAVSSMTLLFTSIAHNNANDNRHPELDSGP
ncbi:hypothetical protein [Vibrio inusitatus]|uniref:hypothetical protein n=1 Tax=Vibrio inusitatus TaxID=413402 RepID=UPI003081327C